MYKLEKNHSGYSILSLDPGSANFGISCTAEYNEGLKLKANAILQNPMKNMKGDLHEARVKFIGEIDYWITSFDCKAIVAERYQARGIRGNSGELISMMMGILFQRYRKLEVRFITAATWKNDFHRNSDYDLKELYKVCRTAPHQLDATLIGIYGLQQMTGRRYQYGVESLLEGVANVSHGKLYNRKASL